MNLKGQRTGMLFTFLAGLIILAHTVVPHHHHYELTLPLEKESTCESTTHNENTEDPDIHCYAFNILVSGNTTNSSLNNSLTEYFSFYLSGITAKGETQPVKNLIPTFFGQQDIFLKQYFVTAQSLRAPPLYS